MTNHEPSLPQPLLDVWLATPRLQAAYQEIAGLSLDEARQLATPVEHTFKNIICYELAPNGDHDPSEAIAYTLPFANRMRPDIIWRVWFIQKSLARPQRIIIFPQNFMGKPMFRLTRSEQTKLRAGDFGPLTKLQAQALEKLGVKKCNIFGYSLGAATGANLCRALSSSSIIVGKIGLFEPPNVMERRQAKIIKDFSTGGWQALSRAINDSHIPALTTLRGINALRERLKDKVAFGQFAISSLSTTNRAIISACQHNRFATDIIAAFEQVQNHPKLTIGNAEHSAITPTAAIRSIQNQIEQTGHGPIQTITARDYGHELGDNLAAHAVLAHMALH